MSLAPQPRVLVIHGPNLNLLGEREPAIYGSVTLPQLDASLHALAGELGVSLTTKQSNSEGTIIDWIQDARRRPHDQHDPHDRQHGRQHDQPAQPSPQAQGGLIINPGGYTHTSVAIHDALRAVSIPVVEVHLSNIVGRETFRQVSVTGVACAGVIMGLGPASYLLALRYLASLLLASPLLAPAQEQAPTPGKPPTH
ncbi:MAG: 3-dehydroquinate dehydratase [Nannocystis sp.]|nr:type II 3-dehydroquinate dehydratase [Nannocystis sp.]MBA3548200.1 3-dehydroquinate dehydratase [Nannocystis sp.]